MALGEFEREKNKKHTENLGQSVCNTGDLGQIAIYVDMIHRSLLQLTWIKKRSRRHTFTTLNMHLLTQTQDCFIRHSSSLFHIDCLRGMSISW